MNNKSQYIVMMTPKKLWKTIQNKLKTGKQLNNNQDIANTFNQYLCNTGSKSQTLGMYSGCCRQRFFIASHWGTFAKNIAIQYNIKKGYFIGFSSRRKKLKKLRFLFFLEQNSSKSIEILTEISTCFASVALPDMLPSLRRDAQYEVINAVVDICMLFTRTHFTYDQVSKTDVKLVIKLVNTFACRTARQRCQHSVDLFAVG